MSNFLSRRILRLYHYLSTQSMGKAKGETAIVNKKNFYNFFIGLLVEIWICHGSRGTSHKAETNVYFRIVIWIR